MAIIEAKIHVIFFREGKKVVAYSPALDLSSCGNTEKQARKRFAEALEIFITETHKMGTLSEVLEECGWCKPLKQGTWSPPTYKSVEESVKIPVGA
jgi:hypothetical protein